MAATVSGPRLDYRVSVALDAATSKRLRSLTPANNIEFKLHLIAYSHETMSGRGRFHFEVVAIDTEFSNRAHLVTIERHCARDLDGAGDTVQRQVSGQLYVVTAPGLSGLCGRGRALKDNVGILIRVQHDLAQLLVDNLFLWFRKICSRLV